LPVDEDCLRSLCKTQPTSPAQATCAPTIEEALNVLRIYARQHDLDPSVATVIRITPTDNRFTLTKAQIKWLGCRGRTLELSGKLNYANIYTPTTWAKLRRESRLSRSYRLANASIDPG